MHRYLTESINKWRHGGMRARIKAELSDYMKNEILLPGIIRDYGLGFREMILLNKAYAIMLVKEKIIDEKTGMTILKGLTQVMRNLKASDLDGKYEDFYFNVEQALLKEIGYEIGGKLHAGRSRNDIYATLMRMQIRRTILDTLKSITELQKTMLEKALENLDAIITGYTHMQPAQPITLAHYYTAAISALNRDFQRLANAYRNTNLSPFGAAALAGTGFPVNRGLLKDMLGFDDVIENSLDCVNSRDYILEAESAFAIMMTNISRVAQDHYIWCTDEFGYLEIDGTIAVCSSIMPQKKNPVSLEYARAKASHSIGAMTSTFASLKNIPFSLCIDLMEATSLYWDVYKSVSQSLGLLMETIKHSRINKEKALERAKGNFSTVTALADYLVMKHGIPFLEAHNIVGNIVAYLIEKDLDSGSVTSNVLNKISKEALDREFDITDEEINNVLDPHNNVQSKKTLGGPSRICVEKMINEANRSLEAGTRWLEEAVGKIETSYKVIEMEENSIMS